ncbi:class I SAM-dependent methyltransferase [Breoghania sp. L-A4]|nr:class I SAM-dependent methyltransferase [Breoghania sp. L-A4]
MPRTRYCGVDRDPKALAAARARHPSARFVDADALDTAERRFDILLSFNVLQHSTAEERRALYALWRKLLNCGGSLILLENVLPCDTTGIHAVSIEEIVLDLGGAFGGCINVETFQTISYPVYDGISPSVLVNLIAYS